MKKILLSLMIMLCSCLSFVCATVPTDLSLVWSQLKCNGKYLAANENGLYWEDLKQIDTDNHRVISTTLWYCGEDSRLYNRYLFLYTTDTAAKTILQDCFYKNSYICQVSDDNNQKCLCYNRKADRIQLLDLQSSRVKNNTLLKFKTIPYQRKESDLQNLEIENSKKELGLTEYLNWIRQSKICSYTKDIKKIQEKYQYLPQKNIRPYAIYNLERIVNHLEDGYNMYRNGLEGYDEWSWERKVLVKKNTIYAQDGYQCGKYMTEGDGGRASYIPNQYYSDPFVSCLSKPQTEYIFKISPNVWIIEERSQVQVDCDFDRKTGSPRRPKGCRNYSKNYNEHIHICGYEFPCSVTETLSAYQTPRMSGRATPAGVMAWGVDADPFAPWRVKLTTRYTINFNKMHDCNPRVLAHRLIAEGGPFYSYKNYNLFECLLFKAYNLKNFKSNRKEMMAYASKLEKQGKVCQALEIYHFVEEQNEVNRLCDLIFAQSKNIEELVDNFCEICSILCPGFDVKPYLNEYLFAGLNRYDASPIHSIELYDKIYPNASKTYFRNFIVLRDQYLQSLASNEKQVKNSTSKHVLYSHDISNMYLRYMLSDIHMLPHLSSFKLLISLQRYAQMTNNKEIERDINDYLEKVPYILLTKLEQSIYPINSLQELKESKNRLCAYKEKLFSTIYDKNTPQKDETHIEESCDQQTVEDVNVFRNNKVYEGYKIKGGKFDFRYGSWLELEDKNGALTMVDTEKKWNFLAWSGQISWKKDVYGLDKGDYYSIFVSDLQEIRVVESVDDYADKWYQEQLNKLLQTEYIKKSACENGCRFYYGKDERSIGFTAKIELLSTYRGKIAIITYTDLNSIKQDRCGRDFLKTIPY